MRFVKPRKPRGRKLNGQESYDMCTCCFMPECDYFAASPLYREKIDQRLMKGKCPACGRIPCKCKSKLTIKNTSMVTHNNKKARRKNEASTDTI